MKHKVKAKKKFGQNFLKDQAVVAKIIESMPKNEYKLIEIGPGLGDLTNYLVKVKSVEAFEVDPDLCELLQKRFSKELSTKRLQLHCGDVLQAWQSSLSDSAYDLVANLPYYIATNIILKALEDKNCCNILVMVQLEVAQKFAAKPKSKKFGALSIIAQSIADVSITQVVSPSAFEPAPKVESAVLLLQKKRSRSDKDFEAFLKIAFKQPRKTLMKNLRAVFDKALLHDTIAKLGFQVNIRPHELSCDDYHQLYNTLQESLDGRRDKERTTTVAHQS